jgi:uncharacterized 2Fe-2S/4Fe-4S cluster protein (DUF4445 family)
MAGYEVKFQPDGIKIQVSDGSTIMEAAQRAGIALNSFCGGIGTCKKCTVELPDKQKPILACQYHINSDLVVTIPESSRFFEQKILEEGITREGRIDPLVSKNHVKLTPPTLEDLRSDGRRLLDAIHDGDTSGPDVIGWPLLKQLPRLLRENDYDVTAVCHNRNIIALEEGDTTNRIFGAAVDIGTTTVVVSLMNLTDGKTVAVASQTNPQVTFGDDVISRIQYSRDHKDGLENLHRRITGCINELLRENCEKAGVDHAQIYELTAAGNATMQHLLLEIPVVQIAQAPYVSVFSAGINIKASELGIEIHPQGNVYVMPSVAAHVGGDTVAVALSTALRHSENINIALDIGTNGEVVLGNQEKLLACSTAAGPAFEGARIRCGMRGAVGAIERVNITDKVEISVIGDGVPTGICGSGLIDAVAELLNAGVLDKTGRLLTGDDVPSNLSPAIRERIVEVDGKPAFLLAPASQTKHGEDIVLTQRDIRELQLGKGAIRAGMVTLMRYLGIEAADINRLYLAGAFGNYIRPESACRIGLLPEVEREKIQAIGNAASTGAIEVLLSKEARLHAEQLSCEIEYIELASRKEFQELFSSSMMFPEN